ncbi:TetR/AcrR family transcriptional regulator [Cellulomonas soli]|uniref:TetR family transcriptional regulator n=1 Tax=Cellulomonas soli TaxID=931535 RepID=A0A512P9J3_9CELL|nr:TetR/AcrR family transcriptional regulator [Cellulomonas soli]NYI60352.1 AcrR family transcriptional regulator [Cellulomonas soli]GEP67865.1 TetR family transcriptional regulator [Cellulomonas soli]
MDPLVTAPADPVAAPAVGPSTDTAPRRAGRRERGTGVREQILDAAVALIAERGFGATSVDDIASAAGVAKGSVFYNFGSKSALFETVLVEGIERLTTAMREAVDGLHGRAAVESLVGALLTRIREHPDFAKVLVAEVFRTGRDWQESIRVVHDEAIGTFAAVVAEEWPERDATLTGAAMFGAAVVAGLSWLVFQPQRPLDEVRAAVLDAVH